MAFWEVSIMEGVYVERSSIIWKGFNKQKLFWWFNAATIIKILIIADNLKINSNTLIIIAFKCLIISINL